jgi:hypothetical protein
MRAVSNLPPCHTAGQPTESTAERALHHSSNWQWEAKVCMIAGLAAAGVMPRPWLQPLVHYGTVRYSALQYSTIHFARREKQHEKVSEWSVPGVCRNDKRSTRDRCQGAMSWRDPLPPRLIRNDIQATMLKLQPQLTTHTITEDRRCDPRPQPAPNTWTPATLFSAQRRHDCRGAKGSCPRAEIGGDLQLRLQRLPPTRIPLRPRPGSPSVQGIHAGTLSSGEQMSGQAPCLVIL